MTLNDINNYISFRTGMDTTNYTPTDRVNALNRWLNKIWTMILASEDSWDIDDPNQTAYPIITTPLKANQRDYTLPQSLNVLKILRVDVTYDGTNYYRANPIDDQALHFGVGNDTKTDQYFGQNNPFYDVKDNALFIYPMPTSTVGTLRVEYQRDPIQFTTSNLTTSQLPPIDTPWHFMLALGAIYDWASAKHVNDIKQDVLGELQDYEERLRVQYSKKVDDTIWVLRNATLDAMGTIGYPPDPPTTFTS